MRLDYHGGAVERMKEIAMLDLQRVSLRSLAEALEDHSPETSWWFDPATGDSEPYLDPDSVGVGEGDHPEERGLIRVEPILSREAYGDMEDFIGRVRDPGTRGLLERAIAGRGAFRRFKDALLDLPELRQAWFAFHDARMGRRAIEWLVDQGLVEPAWPTGSSRRDGTRSSQSSPQGSIRSRSRRRWPRTSVRSMGRACVGSCC